MWWARPVRGLYSKVGYCSALGPSYELAHQTLKVFGIDKPTSGVRDLTNHLSEYCYDYGEDQLMLRQEESLAGKRVAIGLDGGSRSYAHLHGRVQSSRSCYLRYGMERAQIIRHRYFGRRRTIGSPGVAHLWLPL